MHLMGEEKRILGEKLGKIAQKCMHSGVASIPIAPLIFAV
jgi:hypothetical protein